MADAATPTEKTAGRKRGMWSVLSAVTGFEVKRVAPAPAATRHEPTFSALAAAPAKSAAVAGLPDPGEPKIKGKGAVSTPTIFTSAKPDTGTALTDTDRQTSNLDLTTLRTSGTTKQNVEVFAKVNPEMSAAKDAYLRAGLTKYVAVARDRATGAPNPEATALVLAWCAYNDNIGDYTQGYVPNLPIRSVLESLGSELRVFGSCMIEVVLDQTRTPARLQPVGTRDLKWFPSKDGKYTTPKQTVGGADVDLNVPTIFYTSLDQSLYTAYSESPMEAALQPVLMGLQFLNDVRRVIRTSVHPRTVISIDYDKLRLMIPNDLLGDAEKTQEWLNGVVASVGDGINGLEPEEALVLLDIMEVELLNRGNTSLSSEYEAIDGMATAKISAGSKVLPSVIGRGTNLSSASVESMLFMKQVGGALQMPINTVMSKALTLVARLAGQDVYVEFELIDINLRPEDELQGFYAQKQARHLELLSWGLETDEECSLALTGRLPPAGYTPRMGTEFYKVDPTAAAEQANQNNYSGTSQGGDGGGGAQNEALKPKTKAAKAGDTKAK